MAIPGIHSDLRHERLSRRVWSWPIVFRNARKRGERHAGRNHLHHGRAVERPQPRAHHRSRRNAAPDSAADVSQRLPAALHPSQFHRPGRGAGIKARFAKALQHAPAIGARQTERKQVRHTRQTATGQPGQKRELAPAPIRHRSRDQSPRQRHKRENADHQANRLVRRTQVVAYVRPHKRQHRTHAQEAEKSGADQRPEAPPKGARGRPHRLLDCSVIRADAFL